MNIREHTFESLEPVDTFALLRDVGDVLVGCIRLDTSCHGAKTLLLQAVLALVASPDLSRAIGTPRAGLSPWRAQVAARLLRIQEPRMLSLHEIAAACAMRQAEFSHAFKAHFGLTPVQWRLAARVEHAKELMRGSKASLTSIAFDCGFAEQSHFTHAFVKLVGQTPSAWRRAHVTGPHRRTRGDTRQLSRRSPMTQSAYQGSPG